MATQPDENTPTIVLVHGAWADATGFDAEIRALQREGFRAVGFANPLRDLAAAGYAALLRCGVSAHAATSCLPAGSGRSTVQTPVSGKTSSTRSAASRCPAIAAEIERTCS